MPRQKKKYTRSTTHEIKVNSPALQGDGESGHVIASSSVAGYSEILEEDEESEEMANKQQITPLVALSVVNSLSGISDINHETKLSDNALQTKENFKRSSKNTVVEEQRFHSSDFNRVLKSNENCSLRTDTSMASSCEFIENQHSKFEVSRMDSNEEPSRNFEVRERVQNSNKFTSTQKSSRKQTFKGDNVSRLEYRGINEGLSPEIDHLSDNSTHSLEVRPLRTKIHSSVDSQSERTSISVADGDYDSDDLVNPQIKVRNHSIIRERTEKTSGSTLTSSSSQSFSSQHSCSQSDSQRLNSKATLKESSIVDAAARGPEDVHVAMTTRHESESTSGETREEATFVRTSTSTRSSPAPHTNGELKGLMKKVLTLQYAAYSISNIRKWLQRMEVEVPSSLDYHDCNQYEKSVKVKRQKELYDEIKRYTDHVCHTFNLCRVLMQDKEVCKNEDQYNTLKNLVADLEPKWTYICGLFTILSQKFETEPPIGAIPGEATPPHEADSSGGCSRCCKLCAFLLPIYLLLFLLLFIAFILIPAWCECEDSWCYFKNSYRNSFSLMLDYPSGSPPT